MALSVAVVAFLGALQVIATQAQGDPPLLDEISEKVARVSGESSTLLPFDSELPAFEATPLSKREAFSEVIPLIDPAPASSGSDLEISEQESETPPASPTPEASATPEAETPAPTDGRCAPDPSGAPYCTYTIVDGDTVSTIAETLGLEGTAIFSAAELIAMSNGLNDAQNWLIVPGEQLIVPNESGVIRTLGDSETVSLLAEYYGVATDEIVVANGLADPSSVAVGTALLIPSPTLLPYAGPDLAVEEGEEATEEPAEEPAIAEESPEATETPPEDATEAPTEAPAEEPTATPEPQTAAATPATPASSSANPSVAEVRDQFAAGYIAAGGPAQHLERLLSTVIPCESGYNLRAYNPAGPFYGLMQFLPETWVRSGGGDWFSAYQQGYNTGVLLTSANPSGQWPSCWR